jgi:uncharacterized protein
MALPRTLKNMNLFVNGISYIGLVQAFTAPKLTRKTEAYRAGGMAAAAHIDLGLEDDALKCEWMIGGYPEAVLRQQAAIKVDAVLLRFAGAYQNDQTGSYDAVEIILRGRHKEIDRGESKVAEKSETKISTECVYYKESVNGVILTEIDVLNMIHIVDGVDLLSEQRKALGL